MANKLLPIWTAVLLASSAPAASAQAVSRPVPSPELSPGFAKDSVVSLTVRRTIDGQGGGYNAAMTLRRTGEAEYLGGIRAIRQGRFRAMADSAEVDRAFRIVIFQGAMVQLGADARCHDAAGLEVIIQTLDGKSHIFRTGCDEPLVNAVAAGRLEARLARLDWSPIPAE